MSFSAPIVLVGAVFAFLFTVNFIPGVSILSEIATQQILGFLAVFGAGEPLEGVLIIGYTWAIVGGLFDLLNFYRTQTLSGN